MLKKKNKKETTLSNLENSRRFLKFNIEPYLLHKFPENSFTSRFECMPRKSDFQLFRKKKEKKKINKERKKTCIIHLLENSQEKTRTVSYIRDRFE